MIDTKMPPIGPPRFINAKPQHAVVCFAFTLNMPAQLLERAQAGFGILQEISAKDKLNSERPNT